MQPQSQRILCLCDGKMVVGRFWVDEEDTVFASVQDPNGVWRLLATQRGNSDADHIARLLLRELAREAA
jgi:hypothetical protein